jgi:hypothetical protein
MRQSFINKITLCKKCRKAFIINAEGNEDTCDGCMAEKELKQKELQDLIGLQIGNSSQIKR